MRWVKLTLPWPLRARYPLITLRLTSSSLAGHVAEAGRRRDRRGCAPCWRRSPRRHPGSARPARQPGRRRAGVVAGGAAAAPRRRRRARRAASPAPALRAALGRSARGWSPTGGSSHRRDVGGDGLGHRAVVGEELLPRLADRVGVGLELLVHLLDEPRVRPERRLLDIWHCHDEDRTARRSIPRQLLRRCSAASADRPRR